MVTGAQRRSYRLGARADRMERTRERIVEAAAALHRELGPARTPLSAVAERAGVQRHTLYRHFPDEASLFQACGRHFVAAHPAPDAATWRLLPPGVERIRAGLGEVYAWFAENEEAMSKVLRDAELVPVGGGLRVARRAQVDALLDGWTIDPRRRGEAEAVLLLVTSFATWRSLTEDAGLTDAAAATLAASLVACAAEQG